MLKLKFSKHPKKDSILVLTHKLLKYLCLLNLLSNENKNNNLNSCVKNIFSIYNQILI